MTSAPSNPKYSRIPTLLDLWRASIQADSVLVKFYLLLLLLSFSLLVESINFMLRKKNYATINMFS